MTEAQRLFLAQARSAPVEYRFDIWQDLQETSAGRQFLKFLRDLFASAELII